MTVKTPPGRVDLDRTRESLERLGLVHAAEQLSAILTETVKEDQPPHRFLDELLGLEISQREERGGGVRPSLLGPAMAW